MPNVRSARPERPSLRHLGLALLCAAIAAAWLAPAHAQNTVAVDPSGKLLQGQPGQTLNGTVHIDNPMKDAVAVQTSIQDFGYNDKGELTFHPAGTFPTSAASWITVNPASLTVQGSGSAPVRYSVTIPQNASPGTHWAVVFFETGNANPPTTGKTLATFKVRVGFVVYVNVGSGTTGGRIAGIVGQRTRPFQYQFAIQYLNSGNLVSLLNGTVDVRNAAGDTVVTIPIKRVVALPGSVHLITARMVGPLPAGDYNALVVFDANNQSKQIAGQYPFHLAQALGAPDISAGKNPAAPSQGTGGTSAPAAPPQSKGSQ